MSAAHAAGGGAATGTLLRLPAIDRQALLVEDSTQAPGTPLRVAVEERVQIPFDPALLRWERGAGVWRQAVHVPGATELSFGFTRFRLPPGAELWIVSAEHDYRRGPYTAADNRPHGELWTPVVPGDRAVVELRLSASLDEDAAKGRPATAAPAPRALQTVELTLGSVMAGYRDLYGHEGKPNLNRQLACNIDVVCPEGDPWRDEIRSVARYTIVDGGVFLCSGQLVADVPGTFTPYFLTADHCGITAANDQTMVVYWNYESPTCGQLGGSSLAQSQSGATLVSSKADVDFSLVLLDDMPDPAFNVFYTGWDVTGGTPSGSVSIHHPGGDEKALSIDTEFAGRGTSCIGPFSPNTHWYVDWELGTSEPGSSGSGLWKTFNRKLIGVLSGGSSGCIGSNPNGQSDCYGRMSAAWDSGLTASQRLADWLDPGLTATFVRDGIDPNVGVCGDSILSPAEGCDDGNEADGDGCSAACEVEAGYTCSAPVPGAGLRDGSFEGGSPSADWSEFSTNNLTPLCTQGSCGAGAGADGEWFAWFGRVADGEVGYLEQLALIPADATTLAFQVVLLSCDSTSDFLSVTVDGDEVLRIDGDDPQCGVPAYGPRSADISAYADGGLHTLRIETRSFAANGGATSIFLDAVTLDGTSGGAGQPGACELLPETCFAETFDAGLGGWTVFNTGTVDADWGTTDDGVCNSNGATPDGNFTGAGGEAACADSDAAGAGQMDAYLCTPRLDLTAVAGAAVRFDYNYQIFGPPGADDSLELLVGTVPPDAAGVAAYDTVFSRIIDAGAEFALPGFSESLGLAAYDGQSDVWACLHYRGDNDWYAQVDDFRLTAQDCSASVDSDGDGVSDDADNCTAVANAGQLDSDGDNLGNACDADIAPQPNDCVVNFEDLAALKTAFFSSPAAPNWNPDADFNGDDVVGFADLGEIKDAFFGTPGPSGIPNACD